MTEDEMVGWHHRLNGHGFRWTLGVGDGQRGLECCSSWGCKRVGHDLATKQQQPSLWSNSHLYMTTGKTMVLTIQTFVDKVMSLLFNTLCRFVVFLPAPHLISGRSSPAPGPWELSGR